MLIHWSVGVHFNISTDLGNAVIVILNSFEIHCFAISEPQNQEIGDFCVVREPLAKDFKAQELWKGRSGYERAHCPVSFCQYLISSVRKVLAMFLNDETERRKEKIECYPTDLFTILES